MIGLMEKTLKRNCDRLVLKEVTDLLVEHRVDPRQLRSVVADTKNRKYVLIPTDDVGSAEVGMNEKLAKFLLEFNYEGEHFPFIE